MAHHVANVFAFCRFQKFTNSLAHDQMPALRQIDAIAELNRAHCVADQAASMISVSKITRTFRPSKSSKMATRSRALMPS